MIVVTGASGFVGAHLVTALVERFPGRPIRLVDVKAPAVSLPGSVRFLPAAIEEPRALAQVVEGAEVVVHLAAKVSPDERDMDELWRVNVEGTNRLFSAAVDAGCRLFLHMSSAGVYGPPCRPEAFREDDPPRPLTPYQRTKWEAERAILEAEAKGTTVNILRPAGLYGPGSHLELPGYRKVLGQRSVAEVSGGVAVHPTNVRDVVEALLAMMAAPARPGAIFNVGGQRMLRLEDLQAMVAGVLGVRRRRYELPSKIAGPLFSAAEPLLARVGRANRLRPAMARGHLFSAAVDDRRFRRRYPDVPIVDLETGLREHIEWARGSDLL